MADPAGPITIYYGGEWPTDPRALGWTAPDQLTVLINPDHPAVDVEGVLAEIIAHELAHVLLGASHVSDGTLLDPSLNGQIVIGDMDHLDLAALTCERWR